MNLKLRYLFSKRSIAHLSRLPAIAAAATSSSAAISTTPSKLTNASPPSFPNPSRFFHSSRDFKFPSSSTAAVVDDESEESSEAMNDFLSRFVHQMRGKLNEAYPDCDKQTINAMLELIVNKLLAQMDKGQSLEEMTSDVDFSDDLWRTVKEVSTWVYQDMEKERKKEKMKTFLQSEDVKALTRFASEVGVRGDMLHELRFKWAREAMEESEFYESLDQFKKEAYEEEEEEGEVSIAEDEGGQDQGAEGGGGLPKRHGKIKYKVYGLNMSSPEWKEVADRIHDAEEMIWPREAKPITGKCKLVTEKIVAMGKDDDPSPLLAEWVELLQPNKVDWISLLDKLKERDSSLYLKVAEHVLSDPSFQADIRDYSKLIDIHAKENRLEDVERILEKMSGHDIQPDMITLTALVHMYSKAGNLEQAKEKFETLRIQGFRPDLPVYSSMIMAYVNAGEPKLGESLLREIETRDIKPPEEICMALMRGFAKLGDLNGAQKMDTTMKFAGYQPTLESCTLLIEACAKCADSNSDTARGNFDYMMRLGIKPDDRCTSMMVLAYEKKNELDKALNLLLQLEKNGFEPGVHTYCVLLDWMCNLLLVDEAEQILGKIAQLGEAPAVKVHVSLCHMYSRAGIEKKALQSLGVLEAKKELLDHEDFKRVIDGLIKGGFREDARKMCGLMEAQGFKVPGSIEIGFMSTQAFGGGSKTPGRR